MSKDLQKFSKIIFLYSVQIENYKNLRIFCLRNTLKVKQ